ncbi:hypothetical protein D3C78_1309480 [compost metagenome]
MALAINCTADFEAGIGIIDDQHRPIFDYLKAIDQANRVRLDILPSLSHTLAAQRAERKGIPTVFSPPGLTHLGGFLLLAV